MNNRQDMESTQLHVDLIVSKEHVKIVKSALERQCLFDKTRKIIPETRKELADDAAEQLNPVALSTGVTSSSDGTGNNDSAKGNATQSRSSTEQRMRIPTTIPYLLAQNEESETLQDPADTYSTKEKILSDLALSHLHQDISIGYHQPAKHNDTAPVQRNPVLKALTEALDALPTDQLSDLGLTTSTLVSSFPETYSIYNPMLLLPYKAFSSPPWIQFTSAHAFSSPIFQSLFAHLASATNTTHVAFLSPIPDSLPLTTATSATPTGQRQSNILRRPQGLTPLYGSFGPSPTPQTETIPTRKDFEAAFWVSTTQNGIHQTWAPLYTMFSRGNIREKTRILHHPSVTSDTTIVDLYAGIGYFAFSYKRRSGPDSALLCWELNPWSVEGLRRGAHKNKWSTLVYLASDLPSTPHQWSLFTSSLACNPARPDFFIFQMDNATALPIVSRLRALVPPIRHVNLGLLPLSRLAWPAAVGILDPRTGGWVRAHENVGVGELEQTTREVEACFRELVDGSDEGVDVEADAKDEEGTGASGGGGSGSDGDEKRKRRRVQVEHVERVKTYAPGVLHVVFDVFIEGIER